MKMFDAGKTRMIGLPYGEKTMTRRYVKPFSSDTGTLLTLHMKSGYCEEVDRQTNEQTDRFAISISRVSAR